MITRYNERSWAIDLISEINRVSSLTRSPIKRAGGERTIVYESGRLFPDVLLYGEESSGRILQGWELKMPDTPVTDPDLIENAGKKAKILGLNSFLVWNITTAVLYVSEDGELFNPVKNWSGPSHIIRRDEVESCRNEWVELLKKILQDLNDFFDRGILRSKTIVDTFSESTVVDIILNNTEDVARCLKQIALRSSKFDAEVNLWWRTVRFEYHDENSPWKVLARFNLIGWINRFIFAHILKTFYTEASLVEKIEESVSISDALDIFENISNHCDFWNIFTTLLGGEFLTKQAWSQITQLNGFLSEIQFKKINQELFHQILQNTVYASKRKIVGQYVTPTALADLLVRLVVDDKSLMVYDPFCGTGTIPKSTYDIKIEYGQSCNEALASIWASDKFSLPLQIATLALSNPRDIGQLLHVFKKDVIELKPGLEIDFYDPNNGHKTSKPLPVFDYIVSNLPFVQFEDWHKLNPEIDLINSKIKNLTGKNIEIPSKSDLYTYLPFYLWFLLSDKGRLGIIVSNSWLGTESGGIFREILKMFYHIEMIVTSAKGKWFRDVDIVTNLIILNKRKVSPQKDSEQTSFVTLRKSLLELGDKECIKELSSLIIAEADTDPDITKKTYTQAEMKILEGYGLVWSSMFADLNWLLEISEVLINASNIFEINRGERRGWDKLFYPEGKHGIEDMYLRPVLKSFRHADRLIAVPDSKAFCCFRSIDELEDRGHNGALSWIKKFEYGLNIKGKRLPEVLKRSGMYWYEMSDSTRADLVASINYDKRLFIAKMSSRAFVNQRLTRFTLLDRNVDIDLCHALLNSILGVFYIEALGFGRGLGALDLNATKIKKQLFMLNPAMLDKKQTGRIKNKFAKLLRRPVFPILEELKMQDRIEFDEEVLKAFGIAEFKHNIINALLELYNIRMAVKD